MAASDDLKRLTVGISGDIYRAEQCVALNEQISQASVPLNDANYGDLFGTVQALSINELILAISKIYERPSARHPNRSLLTAIEFIEEHADELEVKAPILLQRELVKFGVEERELDGIDDTAMNRIVAQTLRGLLPDAEENTELANAKAALRMIRDKQIAHNEDIDVEDLPRTTWGRISLLLDVPKAAIGVIGAAYLNTVYVDVSGTYFLTSDAERAARALTRLLKQAELIDSD